MTTPIITGELFLFIWGGIIFMLYRFQGLHGFPSEFDLQVNGNVVIATEIDSNPGTSVTNFAEQLAEIICKEKDISKENLIWIESYRKDSSFDLVTFSIENKRFVRPNWKRISAEQASKIYETGKVDL